MVLHWTCAKVALITIHIFIKYFVFWRQAICFESQTYWMALSTAAWGFRLPKKLAFPPVKPFGVKYAPKSTLDYLI